MTAVQELEKRLNALPEAEREAKAAALLAEWEELEGDDQIEVAAKSGTLDEMIEEAKRKYRTGRFYLGGKKPTPEEARAAIDGLKAFRKKLRLGGLNLREMIEEGRL